MLRGRERKRKKERGVGGMKNDEQEEKRNGKLMNGEKGGEGSEKSNG